MAKNTTAVVSEQPTSIGGLAVIGDEVAALSADGDMEAIIAENMGAEGLRPSDVTRVTFPRDTPVWDVDGQVVTELRGIPMRQAVNRTFYLNGYQSGSVEPPDCASYDGITGQPKDGADPYIVTPRGQEAQYGGNCARCPLNQWDSAWNDKGEATKGKACREYRQIAFLPLDSAFPIIVRIPPTQLRAWHDYCAAVTKARRYIWETVASLTVAKDRQGNLTLVAALMGVLPDETAERVKGLNQSMNLLAAPAPALLEEPDEDVPPISDDDLGLPF